MRASVHFAVAALITAACRDNPGFLLSGGDDEPASETGATTTTHGATSAETGEAACTPTAAKSQPDACTLAPATPYPPNLAISGLFAADPCGTDSEIFVKRTGNTLHACNDTMCADCPLDRTASIGKASEYSKYDDLLPRDGTCARLWHTSGNIPGTGMACSSTAYAAFDIDDGERLRFAVSYGVDNPFESVTGFEFAVQPSQPTPCPADAPLQTACKSDDMTPVQALAIDLEFRFATCVLPGVHHSSTWTNIVVDDIPYTLTFYAAYQCFPGDLFYSWFLHRD